MKRKIIVSLILVSVLLGVGTGIAAVLIKTKPVLLMAAPDFAPLLVKAITVEPQTVIESITGYGTAQADRYARISAQVIGQIVEMAESLKAGAEVKKGQVLLRVDDQEYKYLLQRAQSMLEGDQANLAQLKVEGQNVGHLIAIAEKEREIAEAEFNRVKELHGRDLAPKREYDLVLLALERSRRTLQTMENQKALLPSKLAQLTAARESNQAAVDLAQLSVERCTIVAPFAGRVDKLFVEVGERVRMGEPLVAILDPNLIEIPIELPVSVRQRVQLGSKCILSVDSGENMTWIGRVERISPGANQATRTFKLYVEVDNAEHAQQLLPGFFVRAVIDGSVLQGVFIIPRGVIQRNRVFVFQEGKARKRQVRIQRNLFDNSAVAGLDPGDIVIVSNLDALYDNARVQLDSKIAESGQKRVATLKPDLQANSQQ